MAPINGTAGPANAVPKKPLLVISLIAWTLHNENVMTTEHVGVMTIERRRMCVKLQQLSNWSGGHSISTRIVLLVICLFLTSPLTRISTNPFRGPIRMAGATVLQIRVFKIVSPQDSMHTVCLS